MNSAQAYVFFTHLFDPPIERHYRKLKADLARRSQPFILAQAGTPIRQEFLNETHFFDFDELRSRGARVLGTKIVPGNEHLAVLDFYKAHPNFEYYWFIEYDVVFSGTWTV